ncbi:MAG: sigma-54 dependent transcriptional regulator [Polyangia bacterium]
MDLGDSGPAHRKLLYRSPRMRQVDEEISKAARSERCVLITGETGTGKELVARALHERSRRSKGEFVPLNTPALVKDLIEAELFGVGRKIATGVESRLGYIHRAARGTLFLDEIGDMPDLLQPKLLRVLQERRFCRVGSSNEEEADVRFICATNKDLEAEIQSGRFRSDLYYRISTHEIQLPPLRERREDIPLLASFFCAEFSREDSRPVLEISAEALALLEEYAWPGNVRELESVLRKCVTNCEQDVIKPDHLPSVVRSRSSPSLPAVVPARRGEPPQRTRPPFPSDPHYERLPRSSLIQDVLNSHLRGARVATLLQTHRGGGRTLARQLAPLCYGMNPVWLTDFASETSSTAEFYQLLTSSGSVRSQAEFGDWLASHMTERGLLVILLGTQGPEELLEEVAAKTRSVLAGHHSSAFLVVGGERLLRLRKQERYSWIRLLPASSFVDVPDLTEAEIGRLLSDRRMPPERAAMIWQHTGGHPWLVYELIRKGISDPARATESVKYHLSMTRKLARHMADPQAREVIHRLHRGEEVASLADPCVRHEPALYAESRLYFDGLLRWDDTGRTQFRCGAVRGLFSS